MSTVDEFQRIVLRGAEPPADLRLLVEGFVDERATPFDELGIVPVMSDDDEQVNDTSYLTEDDLARPDVRANVAAIDDVIARAVWVARDDEGRFLGYWLEGREPGAGVAGAPIVAYDTEGQFEIVPGASLAEACAYLGAWDDADDADPVWDDARTAFAEAGIPFSVETQGELDDAADAVDPRPEDLHAARYEELMAAERG